MIIDSQDQSLSELITNSFKIATGTSKFLEIFHGTVSYLTGRYSAFEYQHFLKPFIGKELAFSAKDFRLSLHKSYYLCLSIKMFIFHIGLKENADRVHKIASSFKIKPRDFRYISRMWETSTRLRAHVKRVLKEIPKDMLHLLDVSKLEAFFNSIFVSLVKYTKSITYTKLRFISSSSNCELTDLHNDILLKVANSFYSLLPLRLTEAHIVNYLKRCIHHCAMNIIESETTQKRGRLVNTGLDSNKQRQFSMLVVSENQIRAKSASGSQFVDDTEVSYLDLNTEDHQISRFELEFSVSEILTRYQRCTKKYRVLCILMGQEDAGFTEFLRCNNKCSDADDNVDVQTKISTTEFNKLLSKYFRIRETTLNVFMMDVARKLAIPIPSKTQVGEVQYAAA